MKTGEIKCLQDSCAFKRKDRVVVVKKGYQTLRCHGGDELL